MFINFPFIYHYYYDFGELKGQLTPNYINFSVGQYQNDVQTVGTKISIEIFFILIGAFGKINKIIRKKLQRITDDLLVLYLSESYSIECCYNPSQLHMKYFSIEIIIYFIKLFTIFFSIVGTFDLTCNLCKIARIKYS